MAAVSSSADRPDPPPGERYPIVVIGGSTAALAAAREAARRGVRVALLRPPTDRDASPQPTTLSRQIRRLQARTGQIQTIELPDEPGIDVYAGKAVFSQHHAVTIGGREIRFRKAVVATGTRPSPAAIDGVERCDCLQVDSLAQLTELPGRLAVIGCGPAACEWAQAFRRFGSQVHLISRQTIILPREERDAAGLLHDCLQQEGIRFYLGCHELAIERTGNLEAVLIGRDARREKLLVDRILLCDPPQPHTAGWGLDSAGVAYSDHGIVVGDRLQTTNRHIFAAGGACDAEFAAPQAAEATARLAVHNALSLIGRKLSRLAIPRCIWTEPAIARVGLTHREAAARQIEIDTYRADLSQSDEATAQHHRQGLITVHVRRRTGSIAGATVAAQSADELIAPLVLLMTCNRSLAALAEVIPCRPSRFEVLTQLGQRGRQSQRSRLAARLMKKWEEYRRRRNKD